MLTATLKAWLLRKSADGIWKRIFRYFKPSTLRKEIEAALKRDPLVVDPPPMLRKDNLTQDAIQDLIRAAVTRDAEAVRQLMVSARLIVLPYDHPAESDPTDRIWTCIANVLIRAVFAAVQSDDELFRAYQLEADLQHGTRMDDIAAGIDTLQTAMRGHGDSSSLKSAFSPDDTIPDSSKLGVRPASFIRSLELVWKQHDELESRLRSELDARAQSAWDVVQTELRHQNFSNAIAKSAEINDWLQENEEQLSSEVRGRTYLLLAHVALVESSELGVLRDNGAKARALFDKSVSAFGAKPTEENSARLLCFEAKLLALDGDCKKARSLLEGRHDASSVSTWLIIAIDEDDCEPCVPIIIDLPLDEKWCEHAVHVFSRTGHDVAADAVLSWASSTGDPELDKRCRVACAKALHLRVIADQGSGTPTSLSLETAQAALLERAVELISDMTTSARLRPTALSGLDVEALAISYNCYRLLGRGSDSRKSAMALSSHRPTSLAYAQAMLRNDVDFDECIAHAVATDYPNYFDAQLLALALRFRSETTPDILLRNAEQLASNAVELQQKERLAVHVLNIAARLEDATFDRAHKLAISLVGDDHFLPRLIAAHHELENGNTVKCEQILSEISEGQEFVKQLRVHLLRKQGDLGAAALLLLELATDLADPELLKLAAHLALTAKPRRLDVALSALETAVILRDDDIETNELLANAYVQLNGFANASECYARLRAAAPSNWQFALNHARCHSLANEPQDALDILDGLCEGTDALMEAHLLRAEILADTGSPDQAIRMLDTVRSRYWDQVPFLAHYMRIAYAAGSDQIAHTALLRLAELEPADNAPDRLLQRKSLEELTDSVSKHNDIRRTLLAQSLKGQVPWLFVEHLFNNVPFWGWRVRTQPLNWLADEPRARATHSIYSTNSYAVIGENGIASMTRVSCPRVGSTCVVDLSALITLHRLGMLEQTIGFFGKILIPPSYLTGVLDDSRRLQPHQLSRKSHLDAIKAFVDAGRILVGDEVQHDDITISEYSDSSSNYRLKDVIAFLDRSGHISRARAQLAATVAHQPATETGTRQLSAKQAVIVDLVTMQTLVGQNLHQELVNAFDSVVLTKADNDQLNHDLRAFSHLAEAKSWHEDLWTVLGTDSRVDSTTLLLNATFSEGDKNESERTQFRAFDAMSLAEQEGLPLLIDDRVCQNQLLRKRETDASASFGTDCVVARMLEGGQISIAEASRAFLQLMNWRYRFLIPPVTVLKEIAVNFAPRDLRSVAWYVHDCMRDQGMFGGREPTHPPFPVAYFYFQGWLENVVRLVIDIWLDESLSEANKSQLSEFSIAELVPSVPVALSAIAPRVAKFTKLAVFQHALFHLCKTKDYSLGNQALHAMATGLGVGDRAFERVAMEAIDNLDV